MKRLLAIISAGLLALLTFNSCEISNEFDSRECEAYLTCQYAGGFPSVTTYKAFSLYGELTENDVVEIFYQLSEMVQPGFISATLEIDFYDWMDNYDYTRVFDFWWEVTNPATGDGFYAWDEFFIE